jgi:hypothetical protein
VSVTATITTAAPTVITRDSEEPTVAHERRPSWRLKIDSSSKICVLVFLLSLYLICNPLQHILYLITLLLYCYLKDAC